jgi:N-acylneuraminate cytidylyltransferase
MNGRIANLTAVIPARGGSTRIPGKNKKLFFGKPIIAYSIETAQKAGLFAHIIVSTDDEEIASIATAYGAEVHWREERFCRNEVGTQDVFAHVLADVGYVGPYACCIYPTAPLMNATDLNFGYLAVKQDEHLFAFSVGTEPLHDAGQFYWGKTKSIIAGVPLIGTYTALVPIPWGRVCDINTMDDWKLAEEKYRSLGKC